MARKQLGTNPSANSNNDATTAYVDSAITSGVVASAAKLTTARTIGGVSFDGTANIVPGTATPTASQTVTWDANKNLSANGFIEAVQTTATSGGTTTLTVSSKQFQQFTGSSTQTVVLPDATTMTVGQSFTIANRSSAAVTVNANGGGLIQTMSASSQLTATLIANGSSAGTWDAGYSIGSTNGLVSISGTLVTTTGASNAGKYIPLLQLGAFAQNDEISVTFYVKTNIDNATARFELFMVQSAAMNNDPSVTLSMTSGNSDNMDIGQFTAVVTTKTSGASVVTLYAQPNRANEIWSVHYMGADSGGTATIVVLTAQSYIASLPAGTQFAAAYINLPVATPTASKHAVTKGYADSGVQTMMNKVITTRSTSTNAPGATPIWNTNSYDLWQFTGINAAITSMTTNFTSTSPFVGQKMMVSFKDNGSAQTITWGTSFQSSGVAALLSTTVANKTHWVALMYDGTKWTCMACDSNGY